MLSTTVPGKPESVGLWPHPAEAGYFQEKRVRDWPDTVVNSGAKMVTNVVTNNRCGEKVTVPSKATGNG